MRKPMSWTVAGRVYEVIECLSAAKQYHLPKDGPSTYLPQRDSLDHCCAESMLIDGEVSYVKFGDFLKDGERAKAMSAEVSGSGCQGREGGAWMDVETFVPKVRRGNPELRAQWDLD